MVVYVERISDEELDLVTGTDPEGIVNMAVNMVEVVTKVAEEDKRQWINEFLESLSEEERTYLVAMADKRKREPDKGGNRAPPRQRVRVNEPPMAYTSPGDPTLNILMFTMIPNMAQASAQEENLGPRSDLVNHPRQWTTPGQNL
ncbi:hypothetical protein L211DRAFT_850908 [Terfezia boudieri ATCC MYA-4762]|uniref:Uncharacterized protein n=1 Tax=Terfezia boudieri ATCC MYA-4762 TaxID=1051890 RepID=A0A3N4LGZ9_9PEZI|nr:hypothetical protein L211DRAFT_850908 [Terfezia boudieri ATCC MYA-4762]